MKILIVDDSEDIRISYKQIIETWENYEVDVAVDGRQAIEKISANPPDLILLDLMMPKIHGYDVCKEIKSNPALKNIKIVILSAKEYASDIEQAKKLGADDYISKMVDMDVFKTKIEDLLSGKKELIKLTFYGTRGSIPTPGRQYEKYGGNTSCIELRTNNELIILDVGTGIRELGISLLKEFKQSPIKGNILITHTHWDHIQGFPFFLSGYIPKNKFMIYGPKSADLSLEKIFEGQFESNYFPVSLDDVLAKLHFINLTEEEINIGDIRITSIYLNHPGMTLGYKIEYSGKTVVYATDNELSLASTHATKSLRDFASNADILITDTQYSDEEYKTHVGWGHSSVSNSVNLGMTSNVKNLVLFHHDPMHSDEEIDQMEKDANEILARENSKINCFAAREGQSITI